MKTNKNEEVVASMLKRFETLGLRPHHSAWKLGYISRVDPPVSRPYKGQFGEGFIVDWPSWLSSRYHRRTYYTKGTLQTLTVPPANTNIDDFAYVVEGQSVAITGYKGHGGAVIIPSVIDGKPVTTIRERAFWCCLGITSVSIPSSVNSIEAEAFRHCRDLVSACFLGDAPSTGKCVFGNARTEFAIHFPSSAAGFTRQEWFGYSLVPFKY
jgi:hypothetical protein